MITGALLSRIGAYAALVFAVWLTGFIVGIHHGNVKLANAKATALEIQQKKSEELAKTTKATQDKYDSAIASLVVTVNGLIASVRNRPNRKLPGAAVITGECPASTGKELSREDSEFLIGFARDAQIESEALSSCYEREDAYRETIKSIGKGSQ